MATKAKPNPDDVVRDAVKVTAELQFLSTQLNTTLAELTADAEELETQKGARE